MNAPVYAFPRQEYGAVREVAPGVHWAHMKLPFALNHVNLWLLEDGDGWTVVDTGYNDEDTRGHWMAILAHMIGARPIHRVIVTHFHPDHVSLAGWFTERFGAQLWMTYSEWMQAQLNRHGGPTADMAARMQFYRENGMGEDGVAGYRTTRPDFAKIILPLPAAFRRMMDGDRFPIGGHDWRVITGAGHSPEHAALWCEALGVLISGDQVLPRISTNVSLQCNEPDGDPLRLYLTSLESFRALPADALVLPSHDRPFHGLRDRLDALAAHHEARLAATLDACAAPRTAAELIPVLFDRKLDRHQFGFAIGEALAHAQYLLGEGVLTRGRGVDGLLRYERA